MKSSSAVIPNSSAVESLSTCLVCFREIVEDRVRCSNESIPHAAHRTCLERFRSKVGVDTELKCSARCGSVFVGVFGTRPVGANIDVRERDGVQNKLEWNPGDSSDSLK